MPYFDVTNVLQSDTSDYRAVNKSDGLAVVQDGGSYATHASIERGFRTRVPIGSSVKQVPNATADPYSWFTDLNAMKTRNAIKSGFDSTAFRTDKGHPWKLEQYSTRGTPMAWKVGNPAWAQDRYYRAFPAVSHNERLQSGYYVPPESDLRSWAALKYGQMAPTSDRFSIPAFVGELREGLPSFLSSMAKARSGAALVRGAGGDYLNIQFGWMPLLNDLRKIAEALANASWGLFAPWGASHRSRGENPSDDMSTAENLSWSAIAYGDYFDVPFRPYLAGSGSVTSGFCYGNGFVSNNLRTRRWIEGEFVYLPQAGFDPEKYGERYDTLFKTDLTPSDLWQLAPWSWLVDWFLDIGKAIESYEVGLSNRVVSTYMYAMEEVVSTTQVLATDIRGENGVSYTGPRSWSFQWEYSRKRRIRANPFGFTLNPESALTAAQFMILGALGLTKVRR
jgi:hypothetical protein